jgi:cytochrome c biogenesis protein CcmG/thiol:disulfide interchange protein DsbE
MTRWILWMPLALFMLFVGISSAGLLKPANMPIRSQLIGDPLPTFSLAAAVPGKPGLGSASLKGRGPRLLNIFASWCVPCIAEAPYLMALKQAGAEIDAIAIRDRPEDVARFLKRYGDPYARIGADPQSGVQIALGSSGVPETFVIDARGVIRYQHIGDIRAEDVPVLLKQLAAAR